MILTVFSSHADSVIFDSFQPCIRASGPAVLLHRLDDGVRGMVQKYFRILPGTPRQLPAAQETDVGGPFVLKQTSGAGTKRWELGLKMLPRAALRWDATAI